MSAKNKGGDAASNAFSSRKPGIRSAAPSAVWSAQPIDQLERDLSSPDTAGRHAPQPPELWQLGITAMRAAMAGM